jgi:hypothetical protein
LGVNKVFSWAVCFVYPALAVMGCNHNLDQRGIRIDPVDTISTGIVSLSLEKST